MSKRHKIEREWKRAATHKERHDVASDDPYMNPEDMDDDMEDNTMQMMFMQQLGDKRGQEGQTERKGGSCIRPGMGDRSNGV